MALVLSFGALLALYWSTVATTIATWSKDPFAHGYLVVPMAVYLTWTRRQALTALSPAPSWWALPWLAALAFVWVLGNITATRIVEQLCLIGMIMALIWALLGGYAARQLMFPVGILFFALPFADRSIPALQDFTASFAVRMLKLINVPVLHQGHVISIPGSSWQVSEACSGINYLVSSLALGFVYAGTTYRFWRHRVGFFVASALVPLIANGLRVFTTILIASYGATAVAAGMEHYLYGMLVFAIITYVLFITCGRWQEPALPVDATGVSETPRLPRAPWSSFRTVVAASIAVLLVAVAPLAASSLANPNVASGHVRPLSVTVTGPWRETQNDQLKWAPRFDSPSGQVVKVFEAAGRSIRLYMVYYNTDQPGSKLAGGGNVLFEPPWWQYEESWTSMRFAGEPVKVLKTRLRSPSSALLVWSWYVVNGTATGNDYFAKLLLARARLFRSPAPTAAIVIATDDDHRADATSLLEDFAGRLSLVGQ
jgi:exosortase A